MAEKPGDVTRRGFAAGIAAATAGAAAATPAAAQIATPGPGQFGPVVVGNYRPVDQIVFGGIGIRSRGMADLRMLLGDDRVRFVGIADVREDAREMVKSTVDGYYKNNECKMYHDASEILARPDIDALLIATSDRWHGLMAMWAAQSGKDPTFTHHLALLELPTFIAALEHLARSESAERVVNFATKLEGLISNLKRSKALARIVEIRTAASQRLGTWSRAAFEAERATIERLLEQGRHGDAVRAAQALRQKADSAADGAYDGAAYDGALAQITLGRALRRSGGAAAALPHVEAARQRFERLHESEMARKALVEMADCLADLGRYEEAAGAYQQSIRIAETTQDPRSIAVSKLQLATVRLLQKNYPDALQLYAEARETFQRLNEPASVAAAWHQIGQIYQQIGHHAAAEKAYQNSLNIEVQIGNHPGQVATLGQLGNFYSGMGRAEDAVRLYRQAAEIAVQLGDLGSEGRSRNNMANEFIELHRYDEARIELDRAIECKKPFGHTAQLWKTFAILSHLERALGNLPAALAARDQALSTYLAYRRDGGAPQIDTGRITALAEQNPEAVRAALNDPDLNYAVAAEIILALEKLSR